MSSTKEYNIIFLGNIGTGKSSIILRRVNNDFSEAHNQTVGVDILKITERVLDDNIVLRLIDTAGQEVFSSITSLYYHNADVCVFVADVTNRDSFRDLANWKSNLENSNNNAQYILAINKTDLMPSLSQIVENEGGNSTDQLEVEQNDFVNELKSIIKDYPDRFWVSAKSGNNVNDLFICAANLAVNSKCSKPSQPIPNEEPKNNCC